MTDEILRRDEMRPSNDWYTKGLSITDSLLLLDFRDSLENDAEFEVEGDVSVPRPSSPQPGPSTQGVEPEGKVKTGKFLERNNPGAYWTNILGCT